MVYCHHCVKHVTGMRPDDSSLFCNRCGRVLEDLNLSQEATFVKDPAGQSKLSGHYVRSIQSQYSDSCKRAIENAHKEIIKLSYTLGVEDDSLASQALAFYKIAIERNFTRGRKSEQVWAACLYIAFRFPPFGRIVISGENGSGMFFRNNLRRDLIDKVDGYLHNEEEKLYKKIIWEEMNREYLEEEEAKEAAAAAAKEAFEANFQNCSEDMLAAKELAESAAATVAKSRKERKQRRAQEAKNSGPAQSAAEATRKMLIYKRLSSKVNLDRLEVNLDRLDNLFDDTRSLKEKVEVIEGGEAMEE